MRIAKYYTGVGSRETPPHIRKLMTDIAYNLHKDGWTLRSGGAEGADQAFEEGWWLSHMEKDIADGAEPRAEIYLPWNDFEGRYHGGGDGAYKVVVDKAIIEEAMDIASVIHPGWNAKKRDGTPVLSRGMKTLHSRNCFQILGGDLDTPSKFVVCYAEPTPDGYCKGGTRTAVVLAKNNGISVFNLWKTEDRERIEKWLGI